ncbi:MAG: hypothetical protein WCX69_00550 [Candidatus Paceibacterota bacterium]
MQKEEVFELNPDDWPLLMQAIENLQYTCSKKQVPVLTALLKRCKVATEEIGRSGETTLCFDKEDPLQVEQLGLFSLALMCIGQRAGNAVGTLSESPPEEEGDIVREFVRNGLPSIN